MGVDVSAVSGGSQAQTPDFNSDGQVNVYDLSILVKHWGSHSSTRQDLNNDGTVDGLDLLFLKNRYGS
jgi:Dockerin type I domain